MDNVGLLKLIKLLRLFILIITVRLWVIRSISREKNILDSRLIIIKIF